MTKEEDCQRRYDVMNAEMQAGFEEKWLEEHTLCPRCGGPMSMAKSVCRDNDRKMFFDCSACQIRIKIWGVR